MEPRWGEKQKAAYYTCTDAHAYFQTAIWIHTALTGGPNELCLDSSSDIPHVPNGVSDPPLLSYFPAGSY